MNASGRRTRRALAAMFTATTLVAAFAAAGCRGEPDAFSAVDLPLEDGDTVRLTYSLGEDRSPTWRGADTVVYSAAGFVGAPAWPGVIAALPRSGGTYRLVMPQLYAPGATRWLVTPAMSPGGDRVAYVSLDEVNPGILCPRTRAVVLPNSAPGAPEPLPPLVSARIIVRGIDAITGEALDPQAAIAFAGVEPRTATELPLPNVAPGVPRWLVRFYVFQNDFNSGGPLAFRPSFSSDGGRVAFSDGLRLFTWTLPGGSAVPLAGGDSLVSAAWSPRGDWIAASRPNVTDSTVVRFLYIDDSGNQVCGEQRVSYHAATGTLVLVKPDGTSRRELGEGVEPAWAPDGNAIYVRRPLDGSIWRVPVDAGAASRVAGTTGGGEPAVSPDGRFLAFTRRTSTGNHDLYVLRIAP